MKTVDVRNLNSKLKRHPILTRLIVPFYLIIYPFLYVAMLIWENRNEAKREIIFGIKVIFLPWEK